jgi:hypothetical protein
MSSTALRPIDCIQSVKNNHIFSRNCDEPEHRMQLRWRFPRLSDRSSRTQLLALTAIGVCATLSAQTCPFDDGNSMVTREGLVLTRYALGLTGAAMVNGTDFAATDAPTIASNIACPSCGLNITGNVDGGGNPVVTIADATIISRKLAGFSGAALTNGVGLGSGSRNTVSAVNSFLLAGCGAGANGWVQGGNSFGTFGIIGTNDDQAMMLKSSGSFVSAQLADNSGLRIIRTATAGAPAVTNGSWRNSVGLTPYEGAAVAGGGADGTNCPDPTTDSTRSCGNVAVAQWASIGGGIGNRVSGDLATVAGGASNSALTTSSTVGGGYANSALGSDATVPGGLRNVARGRASFAAGSRAVARGDGMFLWNDGADFSDFDPAIWGSFGATPSNTAPLNNTFIVRATGGVQFITGSSGSQCFVVPNGTGWNCVSDRNLKHSVRAVSPRSVLAKLATVPVSTWAFHGNERRQIGPMAQDFFRAFRQWGLSDSDRSINSVDAQGVAFAAIQGLNQIVKEKDAEIAKLKADIAAIKKRLRM